MLDIAIIAKHVLIICCYGGTPIVDLRSSSQHLSTQLIDPTDWMAIDLPGTYLNVSVHPEYLERFPQLRQLIPPKNINLEQCDLYNLTFTSEADQELFEARHGRVSCRCPRQLTGTACELRRPSGAEGAAAPAGGSMRLVAAAAQQQLLQPAGSSAGGEGGGDGIPVTAIALGLVIAVLLVVMAMKGFFCDCFGPFKNPLSKKPDDLEGPLDQNSVNRCLEAVRKHHQTKSYRDQQPLISTVSDNYAPFAGRPIIRPVLDPQPQQAQRERYRRGCSPPPSYRSSDGSLNLPIVSEQPTANSTKL